MINRHTEIQQTYNGKSLNELARLINEWAQSKGWNDKTLLFGDMISLFHTELSEAYEEYRNGHTETEIYIKDGKPEGIPVEIADLFIRLLHFCGYHNIDIGQVLTDKMEYNWTRSYRHGGKIT